MASDDMQGEAVLQDLLFGLRAQHGWTESITNQKLREGNVREAMRYRGEATALMKSIAAVEEAIDTGSVDSKRTERNESYARLSREISRHNQTVRQVNDAKEPEGMFR